MITVNEAKELCVLAHTGQYRRAIQVTYKKAQTLKDKGYQLEPFTTNGLNWVREPYCNHPIAVADIMTTDDEKIVAYLHDVIEDTEAELKMYGVIFKGKYYELPANLVKALNAITKRDDESQEEYIARVAENRLATKVKIADMLHNMSDNAGPKQKVKYLTSLKTLLKERDGK